MESFGQDVRRAIRALARDRGFSAVALLALALGIGATTAIFSAVDAVLLRPFPYEGTKELMVVWERNTDRGLPLMFASAPNYADWRRLNRAFDELGAFAPGAFFIGGEEEPTRVDGARVTPSLLSLLGVRPALGRALAPDDEGPGAEAVALISHSLWRSRYGGDSGIVGGVIEIDEEPHMVVGVMPREFDFPPPIVEEGAIPARDADVWLPFRREMAAANRSAHFMTVIGRLRAGVEPGAASAEMARVAGRLEEEHPDSNAGWDVTLVPLRDQVVGAARPQLLVLLGAVAFVLLIACVNVANLMLARGTIQKRELAIRAALGASHGRLLRLTLVESLVLGMAGGVLGLLVALGGLEALLGLAPQNVPRLDEATLDLRVLAFAAATSLATGVLFGMTPAMQALGIDLSQRLRQGGRGGTEGAGALRVRSGLVVSEISLALVLLVGSGLLFQSLLRLRGVDLGFQVRDAVSMRVRLPASRYPVEAERAVAFRELERRLNTAPGIERAGFVYDVPLTADRQGTGFTVEGRPPPPEGYHTANFTVATPGYFRAVGLPLLQGRAFREADRDGAEGVVVINQALARLHFSAEDPLGHRLLLGDELPLRVVGVVGDVRHTRLRDEPTPVLYLPFAQAPWYRSMSLVVRGRGSTGAVLRAARSSIRGFDAGIPIYDVKTVDQVLSDSVAELRFSSLLMGAFSLLATLLAAVGIYGVISYTVDRRRQETGIRMVMGAKTSDILRLVMSQGLRLAAAGVVVGVVVALVLGRALASMLYAIRPGDPITLVAVVTLLLGIVALACWIPAVRATRVDPAVILRAE